MAEHNMYYTGIDGCKVGWLMVGLSDSNFRYSLLTDINELSQMYPNPVRILIDMPVGLLHQGMKHFMQRPCDVAARKILGRKHSSIFSPPCMEALFKKSYEQASETNFRILGKKLSKQSWNIAPRIRQVNAFLHLNPLWRGHLLEAHPELSFQYLNNNIPLGYSKKTPQGIAERLKILNGHYAGAEDCYDHMRSDNLLRGKTQPDDMADALALAVLSYVRKDRLQNISQHYLQDSLGNSMGIWL
ncbi:MAG: DUF429 domain-containing protein [Bacteroidota bacterium]